MRLPAREQYISEPVSGSGKLLNQTLAMKVDAPWTAEHGTTANNAVTEQERMRRFRDAALPHLDDVYTLARYLMQNTQDAEDAAQECYLRALRHFESYRGPAMKPWLLAILRNVCNAEFARRSREEMLTDFASDESLAEEMPMWQEPQATPEKMVVRQQDIATIRRLVEELPEPFREAIVLREMNDLAYQEIAQVAGVPLGTVMSRLARARAMLRSAWNTSENILADVRFTRKSGHSRAPTQVHYQKTGHASGEP